MARVAVIGGGWAGLAAAVEATRLGHEVSVFEMARHLGGRARSQDSEVPQHAVADRRHGLPVLPLDNGQHILIGAYTATLGLMRELGVDLDAAFLRGPLALVDPAGRGLRLPAGPALPAFARGVLAMSNWSWRDRLRMLMTATGWLLHRFQCLPSTTVADLCRHLGADVRRDLIDPLCVSALNTPAERASATVFLRVLRDALFNGPGAADLMLPRRPLGELLPGPAAAWLKSQGAQVHLGRRVRQIKPHDQGWWVDETTHDAVILAASATEAARLTGPIEPGWSAKAMAFGYEPIITVYLRAPGTCLAHAMTALPSDAPEREPAQFAFDHGAISGRPGLHAFVISGAAFWVERGLEATAEAVRAQALGALRAVPGAHAPCLQRIEVVQTVAERRATFACTPGLQRPPSRIAPGLAAAGDYIEGPYPATLEGAVRSAANALQALKL